MTFDLPFILMLVLIAAQAYVWYRFTAFETMATINILGIISLYSQQMLELQEKINKLEEELKKYEQKTKTSNV